MQDLNKEKMRGMKSSRHQLFFLLTKRKRIKGVETKRTKMKRGSSKKREIMEMGIKKFSRTIFPPLTERLVRAFQKRKKKWQGIAGTLRPLHQQDHEKPHHLLAR